MDPAAPVKGDFPNRGKIEINRLEKLRILSDKILSDLIVGIGSIVLGKQGDSPAQTVLGNDTVRSVSFAKLKSSPYPTWDKTSFTMLV